MISVTIQMKATEQYFPVVLFIMLYKMVLTFESVDEILKYDIHMKATEPYFALIPTVYSVNSSVRLNCQKLPEPFNNR